MKGYQPLDLAVVYSDIVGSTEIVSRLSKKQIPIFYRIFPVPKSGWIPRIDDSIRCAYYIREVTKCAISPAAESRGLPKIQCRIGIDYGEAQVVDIGVKGIFLSAEILGHTMNVAAKIRGKAQPDEIAVGENLYRLLHTSYKLLCKELTPLKIDDLKYRVYRLAA